MKYETHDLTHEGLVEELDLNPHAPVEQPAPRVWKRISVTERVSPHRMVRIRRRDGKPLEQFNATKTPSWIAKPKRRAKSKAAKAARKANR